jgi:hypothetical protein
LLNARRIDQFQQPLNALIRLSALCGIQDEATNGSILFNCHEVSFSARGCEISQGADSNFHPSFHVANFIHLE